MRRAIRRRDGLQAVVQRKHRERKRAEQLRQALANGTYRVDASRIADRMMTLDNQLNGKS